MIFCPFSDQGGSGAISGHRRRIPALGVGCFVWSVHDYDERPGPQGLSLCPIYFRRVRLPANLALRVTFDVINPPRLGSNHVSDRFYVDHETKRGLTTKFTDHQISGANQASERAFRDFL
jgi:hypothetical protein